MYDVIQNINREMLYISITLFPKHLIISYNKEVDQFPWYFNKKLNISTNCGTIHALN